MAQPNLVERFLTWWRAKWDNAEAWLPWAIVSVLFVGGVAVTIVRMRGPTVIVEVKDAINADATGSAPEASSPFGGSVKAVSSATTSNPPKRSVAAYSRGQRSPLMIAVAKPPSEQEIENRTGIPAVRARAVILSDEAFDQVEGYELKERIELFADAAPVVIFKVPSGYEVNAGIHTGTAVDDPNSRVLITKDGDSVSGSITYRGRKYRIVSDPIHQMQYIVEVKE